jgi:hypothetical protein
MYPQKVIMCDVNSAVMCYYGDAEIENPVSNYQSTELASFAFAKNISEYNPPTTM